MSINNHSGDNISELIKLWVISSDDVVSLPDPDSDFEVNYTDFSLKSGKIFEKIYFSPNSGIFSETVKKSQSGPFVDKKIVARIPKSRSEVIKWLNMHKYYYHHAVVQDANGEYFLVKDKMSIEFSRTSPKISTDFGGYELTLSADSDEESPHINNCTLT